MVTRKTSATSDVMTNTTTATEDASVSRLTADARLSARHDHDAVEIHRGR
jgi:hypothetical protein